jgi:hypothetical protein
MEVMVIDGQGGGMGRQLVAEIKASIPGVVVRAVGTNSVATAAMRKAGADITATGENAVLVGARKAQVIVGPVGIVIADALQGEITPKMAVAVGQSEARRILIPVNHCDNLVAGVPEQPLGRLIASAIALIGQGAPTVS